MEVLVSMSHQNILHYQEPHEAKISPPVHTHAEPLVFRSRIRQLLCCCLKAFLSSRSIWNSTSSKWKLRSFLFSYFSYKKISNCDFFSHDKVFNLFHLLLFNDSIRFEGKGYKLPFTNKPIPREVQGQVHTNSTLLVT